MTTKGTETNKKEDLLIKDRKYMWHHMSKHNENPMIFVSGKDSWIEDVDGENYIDGMSGLWCVNVGHGRKEIAEVAASQMGTLAYSPMSQSHIPGIELADKINEWLEGEYRIFYSNSGSDANEVAFKIARQYFAQNGQSTRYKFISRYRGYHGNSIGAMAATGQAIRKSLYGPAPDGFKHVPPPYCYRCPFGKEPSSCQLECVSTIRDTIEWEGAETVAGIILEPTITGGGLIIPPKEYVTKVRELCDEYGILMIVDEVICGFGRSGEKFGHQNFQVKPDIVTMAKGLTSAYAPLSITAVRADLYNSFKDNSGQNHFRHVNTFGGNPVSCAVALKNIEILENENLVERARELGRQIERKLQRLEHYKVVGDIRVFGFAAGIELVEDKRSKKPLSDEKMMKVLSVCKENHVILGKNGDTVPGHNNIITISPPFVLTDEELEKVVASLECGLMAIESE
ncbi:aminotransferase [Halalkalibacter alkaliphilus]|uniref:Aminotransferase n=1 Tax=Halalkalibacter alkaliphilus TaxID=2917993 RepID=A0A9X2A2S0_9BACI|nr:aminotransferase [Halalkalibacter alkaliphilus]MCL7745667.1 aminotransferase [Halalkalibacter alkaliphilus]